MGYVGADRELVRLCSPARAEHGNAFSALRIGPDIFGDEADPFLNLDHFRMAGPTFPPHAHAGFSAVTYVLPESGNNMLNRDSRGDRSIIAPGGLHWTAAGSGLVHEEVPERPGEMVEGMQIFIRQPTAQEVEPAVIHHVDVAQVPQAVIPGGGRMRVLAGSYESLTAPFVPPSPLRLIDLELEEGTVFHWPDRSPQANPIETAPMGLALYLFSGSIDLGEPYGERRLVRAPNVAIFARSSDQVAMKAVDGTARLLLLSGERIGAPSYTNGPFVLSSQEALNDAIRRYRSGEMGTLSL